MNEGTLKVTSITATQPQAVAKFSITASIDGFPITVEVEGKADALRGMIDRLKAIGAEPPAAAPGQVQTPAQAQKPAGVPVCPVHNAQMKVSSARPGSYFCPKKNEDGSYCKSKA